MDTVLHIGTGKTGTSSLQVFMHNNRSVLAEHGILFTKKMGHTNNIEIAKYGMDSNEFKKSFFFKNLGIQTNEQKKFFDEDVERKLNFEVSVAKSKGINKAIISSEHFATDLRSVNNIKRIKSLFEATGINVKTIVIYIREQASYIFSDYNTRVLMGEYTNLVPAMPSSLTHSVLNHSQTIKIWSETFRDSEVKVRIFEKEKLHNGNSVDDFLKLTELDQIKNLKTSQGSNESLSKEALAFLIMYNQYVESQPQTIQEQLHITNNRVRNTLLSLCRQCFDGEALKPTKEQKTKMYNLFRASNDEVKSRYLPSQESLFTFSDTDSEPEVHKLKLEQGQMSLIGLLLIELLKSEKNEQSKS